MPNKDDKRKNEENVTLMANILKASFACSEIEACRNLIMQLAEKGRKESPFGKEEGITVEKLNNYMKLIESIKKLLEREKTLIEEI